MLQRKVTGSLQFSLAQSFSNLNAHGTQLEDPLKCRHGFSSSGVGGGFCISNKLSSDEAAAPASGQTCSEHLERHCPRERWANPSAPSHWAPAGSGPDRSLQITQQVKRYISPGQHSQAWCMPIHQRRHENILQNE